MSPHEFTIRTMTRGELDLVVEWADAEGWNPGRFDADCYFKADPTGFLVGLLKGEPIASISVVKYGKTFAFLGFYLVVPAFRGKGYGLKIWRHGMKTVKDRNVGLDGVVDQQANYKKSGFKLAYQNIRYQGTGGGRLPDTHEIVPLARVPLEEFHAYDRSFFPENRTRFMASWICQPEAYALGLLQKGTLSGYGMIRQCRKGYKIGPLFAENYEQADVLFRALKSGVSNADPVFLDTPQINPGAIALAEHHGMTPVFETARMYTGCVPDTSMDRVFGVTSFELG
ncbi:MAG: GNAT family N-acetyltransferase [Proteobacteria bacterium]|nr:GNAT family N-acetyltransferase [Desulfobacula sp.]MBU4131022.1 GNAT family N-acetyltransferase [Pseudomonadota bacterium]